MHVGPPTWHAHGREAQTVGPQQCCTFKGYEGQTSCSSYDADDDVESIVNLVCNLFHVVGVVIISLGLIYCGILILFEALMLGFACKLVPNWNAGESGVGLYSA